MKGSLRLTDGTIEIPSLGEEFGAIAANVKLDGENVTIDEFRAEGTTGKVTGGASLHVSGYTIDRATVNVKVPKSDPLPVAREGETLADVWGTFGATLTRRDGSAPEIRLDVSKAGVRLPELSSHSLQSLEPADRVRIGVMKREGLLEVVGGSSPAPPEANEEGMTVKIFAKDVEVRRGTDLRVRLDGEPVVKTGRDEGVYGSITLKSGQLYVQGKKFEIEKGVVTFHGEADNPDVVVTAAYAAPEDTRIYADFVGPLKTGKLTLRSDPPHTKSEILSLILFGTTTGNATPPSGSSSGSATAAAGIGGGFAAQGLTRALDDLIGVDVTARVDTTQSANPRPEVEVRVARDVTVSLAHVLGVPAPGSNPDRNFARIDFRLLRNWSLQTTVGDQGSSLFDLVWQYRY
jgi:translocation and assembly module TamB